MAPIENMDMRLDFPKRDSTRNALNYRFEDDSAKVHAVQANLYYQTGTRIMDNTTNVDIPAKLTPPPAPAVKATVFTLARRSHYSGCAIQYCQSCLARTPACWALSIRWMLWMWIRPLRKPPTGPPLPAVTTPAFLESAGRAVFLVGLCAATNKAGGCPRS